MAFTRSSTGLLFRDQFARADGPVGANYVIESGTWVIEGGKLKGVVENSQTRRIRLDVAAMAFVKNQHVQASISRSDLRSFTQIMGRLTADFLNFYLQTIGASDAGSGWPHRNVLYRQTGGGANDFNVGPLTSDANDVQQRYTFSNIGNVHEGWIDGAAYVLYNDATAGNDVPGTVGFVTFGQGGGPGTSTAYFSDLIVCSARTLTVSGLPAGYAIRANGLTSAASDGVTDVVLDLAGTLLPVALVEVLDGGAATVTTFADAFGGDVFVYAATPATWVLDLDNLTVADLSDTALFPADDPSGGVVATYSGLPAIGFIDLPATVDRTKAFMFAALFEFNGDTERAQVSLVDPDDTSFNGFNVAVSLGDLRAASGTFGWFLLDSPAVAHRVWLGLSWSPTGGAVAWMMPEPHGGMGDPTAYLADAVHDYARIQPKNLSGGGVGEALEHLTQIMVQTSSTTTRVISVIARQGTLDRGPAVLNPVISGDDTTLLRVPAYSPAGLARSLVVVFHGAGSAESQGSANDGNTDGGVAVGALVEAGYFVLTMRGTDDGDYAGAQATNFGATAPLLDYWQQAIDDVKARFTITHVFALGQSMGLINALNLHAIDPTLFTAIAGISGVTNLAYAYTDEGYNDEIDAAYGSDDVTDIAGFDPVQRGALYNVPIRLWFGDADTVLDHVRHADFFQAAVQAAGFNSVAVVTVPGADHLVASLYDGPALIDFFAGLASAPLQPTFDATTPPNFRSSAFASYPPGPTHLASQWQITTLSDPTFATPVRDTGTDAVNLTTWSPVLAYHTPYLGRVRHRDSLGQWSPWSTTASIAAFSAWTPTDLGPEVTVPAGMASFAYGRGPEAGKTFHTLYFDQQMTVGVNLGDPIRPDFLTVTWPFYVVPGNDTSGYPFDAESDGWQSVVGTGSDSALPTWIYFDKPIRKLSVDLSEMTFFDHELRLFDKNGVLLHTFVLSALQFALTGATLVYDLGSNLAMAAQFVPSGDWITYKNLVIGMDVSSKHSEWSPTDLAPDVVWTPDTDVPPATVWTP